VVEGAGVAGGIGERQGRHGGCPGRVTPRVGSVDRA
jgi:hypothetical protein